jgi:hypothetical protein
LAELGRDDDVAAALDDDQAGPLYGAVAALALREADDPRCRDSAAEHLLDALQAAIVRYRDHQDFDPDRVRQLLAASFGLAGVLASQVAES